MFWFPSAFKLCYKESKWNSKSRIHQQQLEDAFKISVSVFWIDSQFMLCLICFKQIQITNPQWCIRRILPLSTSHPSSPVSHLSYCLSDRLQCIFLYFPLFFLCKGKFDLISSDIAFLSLSSNSILRPLFSNNFCVVLLFLFLFMLVQHFLV